MADVFRLLFNSGAKTKKEIQNELQRLIRAKIEDVIETAITEVQEERGEKIPERDNLYYGKSDSGNRQQRAENSLAYPPEVPDESAPITEKIRQMRELGQTLYNGYMVRHCAEIAMVRQGEFMQDVEDDFGRSVFCAVERPVYGALSFEQLRTYFTWRTDVRRGVYNRVDKPYIMLYCYELLNKIGVLSSQDAFNRLLQVWENCRGFCHSLDYVMPKWLKDFYAFNKIDGEFCDIAESFPVKSKLADPCEAQLMNRQYDNKLGYLMEYSHYNLAQSMFFNSGKENAKLMNEAVEAALAALDEYFSARGISLFELICGKLKKDFAWSPFAGAYVNRDRMDGFRACRISGTERYCIKRGEPCFEHLESAPYRRFIGYVLKSVEAVLRTRTGFRYNVSPNLSMVMDDFYNREKLSKAVKEPEFCEVIPRAVNEFCDRRGIYPPEKPSKRSKKPDYGDAPQYTPEQLKPRKVEIDISALEHIRREADEIAEKLIVEEYEDALSEEQTAQAAAAVADEVFEELRQQALSEAAQQHDFSALPQQWRDFAAALDERLLDVLLAMQNGTVETLCRDMGRLPETVFDEINALSLEYIGDVVIENGEFVPDYCEDIGRILDIAR